MGGGEEALQRKEIGFPEWVRESWLKLEKAKGGWRCPEAGFLFVRQLGLGKEGLTSSPDPLTGRPLSVFSISLTKSLS